MFYRIILTFFLFLSSSYADNISSLNQSLKALLPGEKITATHSNNNIVLQGIASSSYVAKKANEIAAGFVESDRKIIDVIKLKEGQQVLLKVRFGEIDRKNYNNLAVRCNSAARLTSCLNNFASTGVFKVYNEPSLVAISGENASFASGGEFPIYRADGRSVSYKPHGVKLSFTPTVISHNSVKISMNYEISKIERSSFGRAPRFTTSSASTSVELAPGESFMIAGMVSDDDGKFVGGNKGLFSKLSPSSSYEQKEVVIAITPYLVNPTAAESITLPTDGFDVSTELEKLLNDKLKNKNGKNSSLIIE